MTRLKNLWLDLNAGLWFLPALMVAAAIVLAVGLIEADGQLSDRFLARWPRLFGVGVEGSRGMLSLDEGRFLPALAVLAGIALALASVGVLILFIHHIATSIQANTIICAAAYDRAQVDAATTLARADLSGRLVALKEMWLCHFP